MKIRNLAFCGVMASILGVSGAYAADATIIASKAYVDARDNTKQDNLGGGATAGKVVTATSTAGTVDYTGIDSTVTANSTNLVTSGAVASAITSGATDAINALDLTAEGQTGVIKTVTQTDGQVAVTSGTVNTNDITDGAVAEGKIADSAVTAAKLATNAVTTAKIADGNVTMPKTDFVVQQGTSGKDWANADANSENTDEKALATAKTNGDKYVPTVAAVEKRIKQATDAISSGAETGNVVTSAHTDYITKVSAIQAGIAKQGDSTANWNTVTAGTAGTSSHLVDANAAKDSYIPTVAAVEKRVTDETSNMTDSTASATYDSTNGITIATAGGAGNQSKFATSAAVASTANALKDAIDATNTTVAGLDVTDTATNQAVTAVNQTDGKISVTRSKITFDDGLKSALSEINATGGDYSSNCKKNNPCVLTYFDGKYEWTTMDTDNLEGVL